MKPNNLAAVVLLKVTVSCGGDLRVAEEQAEPPDAGGSVSEAGVPGTYDARPKPPPATPDPADVTVPPYRVRNDPCDEAGFVVFRFSSPLSSGVGVVSGIGYLVAFDPPRILGSVPLEYVGGTSWEGEIDPRALPESPSCQFLRSAGTLATFVSVDETTHATAVDLGSFYIGGRLVPCESAFSVDDVGAETVRAFGMVPGDDVLDGPVPFERDSSGQWIVHVDVTNLPRCANEDYVTILAAHRGAELMGLHAMTQNF